MFRTSFVFLLLLLSNAGAGEDDRMARSRARFEAGRALYSLGDYDAALREFAAGYQLVPKPQFLINLGQTYRKLERFDKAREMFNKFLNDAAGDDSNRPAIGRILLELDQEEAAFKAQHPQPELEPPSPSPIAAAVLVAAPPPLKKPFNRRHLGWIVPLTLVVLGGAAAGIYFALRPGDGCVAGLACVDSTRPMR